MKKVLSVKFIKFALWGVINNFIAYGIYASILWAGIHYTLAAAGGWFFGVLLSFFTMSKFVFRNNDKKKIIKFYLVYVALLAINTGILTIYSWLGLNLYIGGLANMAIIPFISYFLLNVFVFTPHVKST